MAKLVVLSDETRLLIEARLHISFRSSGLSRRDRVSLQALRQKIATALAQLEDYQATIDRRLQLDPGDDSTSLKGVDDSEDIDDDGVQV